MRQIGWFVIVIVALLIGPLGCATYQSKVISASPIDSYADITTNNGISFAADSYDNSEKAKEAFYVDVNS